jgi:nicotinamide riboside transporter PnuC
MNFSTISLAVTTLCLYSALPVSFPTTAPENVRGFFMFEWILTDLSILGTVYNLQKRVAGWIIWSISNIGWIVSFSTKGMMAEAFLFCVYLVLSVYGIFKWWTPREKKSSCPESHDKPQ